MNGDVRRVPDEDRAGREIWELLTDDDVRGVRAVRCAGDTTWMVTVDMMLCIREEPLEGELRRRIASALQSVDGVGTVEEEDREDWIVTGTPSPIVLVRVAAWAVDSLTNEIAEAFTAAERRERRAGRRDQLLGLLRPRATGRYR